MSRRDSMARWYPVVFMYTGWGMCLVQFAIALGTYAMTGRAFFEPAFLGLFGSMAGIGHITDAIRDVVTNPPSRDLPPVARSERE